MSSNAPVVGHKPKTDFVGKHKVITYGERHVYAEERERRLYHFRHQRADLKVSDGVIPVGFLSKMWLEEGHPIFIETRAGGWDEEREHPDYVGPEFQVSWTREKIFLPPGAENDGWTRNLDELWIAVLSYFERKNLLSEETLDFLDADPFVLFGLDNDVTQQAIEKLERFPALICVGATPSIQEWADYLRVQREMGPEHWLVESMKDTELPKPWTCYKGVGSIVCFMRSDTGQVTWKHPFYDYFRQLRDFCRQATTAEVLQVRVHRLLWAYEGSRVETEHYQEPLIAPDVIEKIAQIFGYDVAREGSIVRNLKAQLKIFSKTYNASQEVDIKDVINCADELQRDVDKYEEMKKLWSDDADTNLFDLKAISNGKINCVNCDTTALAFCLECKDYLCLECYDTLHQKGSRREHAPFRMVACGLCVTLPAKLHCTFTDKSLCHECYALKHIRTLPPDGKENEPRRIDYGQQYIRYATLAKERIERQKKADKNANTHDEDAGGGDSFASVLSQDWHPFYDSRGVKFYHNFVTGERMRQSPRRVPNTADPGAPEERLEVVDSRSKEAGYSKSRPAAKSDGPLTLTGFDSLSTGPVRAVDAAAAQPELRTLRAPHRMHMPNEVRQC
jgi:hypothetical protein